MVDEVEERSPEGRAKLALYLARKIFEAPFGCKPDEVQRIQFRGRGESDMGGLCEDALICHIAKALEQFK